MMESQDTKYMGFLLNGAKEKGIHVADVKDNGLAPNIARAIRDNDPRYKIFLLEEAKKRGLYVDDLEEDYDVDEGAGDNIFGEKSDYEDSGNHESEGSESEEQNQSPDIQENEDIDIKGIKKTRRRGPTELKKFWKEFDPKSKLNLEFNHNGQPCGLKTSKLTNFIGNLVKGKEISLEAANWSKVSKSDKTKLWNTVKAFFNIDDSYKIWVLRSASKKWKNFKSFLKRKYFKPELSEKQNVTRGCEGRIPPKQWAWLVNYWSSDKGKAISEKNKATRLSQQNGSHTSGSRAFAVVHDQMEIKEGRRVSRAELYVVTHRNKKGEAVDDFCAAKIDEIEGKLKANPELLGEKEHEGDVYATAFPKARISRTHGLGLVVGGKGRVQLAQAVAALEESRAENRDLRQMVETLMAKSEKMEVKSEKMEEQYNEIKTFLIASQKQQASQHDGKTHGDIEAEAKVEASQLQDDVKNRNQILTQRKTQEPGDSQTKKSYEELQSETTMLHKVKVEKVEERDAEQALQTTMLHKVKVEKVEERNAEQERIGRVQGKVKKTSGQSKAKKVKVAKNNVTEENLIKRGMEVGLTSPNSAQLVALGTVQNVDKAATCLDGKPLCDYVEILINVVLKGTTILPRAQGRVTNMGTAQAMSIPWPRGNITQSDGSSLHSKVSTMISERSVNLKEAAAAKKQAKSQAEMIASESQSQNVAANTCKKRRISGKGEAKIKKMSQAIAK